MFFVMYAMIATLDHLYFNISNVYMTMMMFTTGWAGMRLQLGVGDAQLVRSMIPHHSGAILMCREAKLSDPEVVKLCRDIIAAQKQEIGQLERILQRL